MRPRHRTRHEGARTKGVILSKNIAVFGIYSTRSGLESGLGALRSAGFRPTGVSVLFPEDLGNKDLAYEKNTKAPEGAATGALSGAVIGGTPGWLAGIGTLTGLRIPEHEAKRFEGRLHHGAYWTSVHCDIGDWSERAEAILRNTGADDISSTSESRADFASTGKPVAPSRGLGA